jgi:hypothetical protein
MDIIILKPDGTEYANFKDMDLWKNKTPIPENNLGLAVSRLGLIIEKEDPLGIYTFICNAKDLVSGEKLELKQTLDVIE